jgi:hypothetical protein
MAKKLPPLHIRKATVLDNWQHGDNSVASRILTDELRIPTSRNAVNEWRRGGYSKLEAHYVEAMEKAQARRAEKAAATA